MLCCCCVDAQWLGDWQANNACDRSVCCCLGTFSITPTTGAYRISGNLQGVCGGSSTVSVFLWPPPTGGSVAFQLGGESFSASLASDSISLQNLEHSACSGGATRATSSSHGGFPPLYIGVAVGGAILLLLVGGLVCCCIRRRKVADANYRQMAEPLSLATPAAINV